MVANECVYLVGGWSDDAGVGRRLVSKIDKYDTTADSWSVETVVPTPRYHAGVALVNNKIYIVGGFLSDSTFDRATGIIECYDLEVGMWVQEKSYPLDTWEHACVSLHVPRCREGHEVARR